MIAAVFAEMLMGRLERDPELPSYLNKVCLLSIINADKVTEPAFFE